MIVSDHHDTIAKQLIEQTERGIIYIKGQNTDCTVGKTIIYCVVSRQEIAEIRFLVKGVDRIPFVSIINVHGVLGEAFSFSDSLTPRKKTSSLAFKH